MTVFLVSALSGLLTGFSFNFNSLSFLVWFSLTFLIWVVKKSSWQKGLICGLIFAIGYYGVSIFWISRVTILGLIVLIAYLSLYYILFSLLSRHLSNRFFILTIPCLWVVLEFLKEVIWCGFGWANLGYSQYKNIYLIQIADIFGVKFISFLIVMVNCLFLEIVYCLKHKNKHFQRKIIWSLLSIVIIFLSCSTYSFLYLKKAQGYLTARENLNSDDANLKVSVIQPNILQELKWKESSLRLVFKKMRNLASSTEKDSLVIFPEAAWPAIVNDDNFFEFKSFFNEINRDTLVGAVTERDGKFYNTALLLDKEGECLTLYNKVKLVPFGEYVPFRKLLKFIGVLNSLGDITPGSQLTRFTYRGKHFSVLICFEDIFPLQVRRVSRNSDFLVNITNDAWFRSQSEANQHLSIMTLRAVENRISIIRSSNTGISAKVSFNGQIEELKDKNKNIFFSGQKSFNIILSNHRSFYNTHGEIFPVFCLAVIIITALAEFLKRRRISLDANH